jgi:uncharacterized protein
MKIIVTGGTGFLGRPLTTALAADGHEVIVLARRPASDRADGIRVLQWTPGSAQGAWIAAVDGADAIVNLAGEPIAARRWSPQQKRLILKSRVEATRTLADAVRAAAHPPGVFISGSAVGFYGPCGEEVITEAVAPGPDFLAWVCVAWETEAAAIGTPQTRVACVRTGLVLERDGGALPKMLTPFRLGAGGRLGSGRQYWPWIHRRDWIALVRWALVTPAASGPINATAPHPVTNSEFASVLGRVLHRPALLAVPAMALRLALGEMADGLLLSGQRAVPDKAERLGFSFAFTQLDDALRDILA